MAAPRKVSILGIVVTIVLALIALKVLVGVVRLAVVAALFVGVAYLLVKLFL
jgi:hypothetical protein